MMQKITRDDDPTRSADLLAENVERLRELFPEAFSEGRIDFEVLKQLLGGAVDERDEKYGLNWFGKRQARQSALTPSTGTLRPCPEESVDWDTTQNLMIEGDNPEVLKLLQKSYAGKVTLIYIDPPYNTGRDFVYPDDYRDNIRNYLELTGQIEGDRRISSNTESSGRFHTDWLNMMYPRLKLARSLLRDDGVIFVSIDATEGGNLQAVLSDVFGEENFVASVAWQKRVSPANDAKWFSTDHDLLLVYARDKDEWRPRRLPRSEAQLAYYQNPDNDPRGDWNSATYTCNKTKDESPNLYYAITNPHTGQEIWPKETAVWKYGEEATEALQRDGRLYWGVDGTALFPRVKLFLSEMEGVVPRSVWSHDDAGHTQEATSELGAMFGNTKVFDSPKPVRLIRRMLQLATAPDADAIVLDFFAGSGTTGHAVLAQNAEDGGRRRSILVQLPEPLGTLAGVQWQTIADVTKDRMRRAARQIREDNPLFSGDTGLRVFKLDTTNIREWDPDRSELDGALLDAVQHLKDGRTEQDILYELLLKLGLDLCVPIEDRAIAGHTVHSIGAGVLLLCLAEDISRDEVEPLANAIAGWRDELQPAGDSLVVFRDSAFADDVAKVNLTAILHQRGLLDVRSL